MITFKTTKREVFKQAWKEIFEREKTEIKKDWRFKHVNPNNFNKLQREINNICIIAYSDNMPIGIFGATITENDTALCKQIVVAPSWQRKGIGKRLITEMEIQLRRLPHVKKYTIVCLDGTANIYHQRGIQHWKGPLKSKEIDGITYEYEYYFLVDLYKEE